MTFARKNGPIKFFKRAKELISFFQPGRGHNKKGIDQISEFYPPGSLNMQPDTDRHYTIFPLNPKRTHSPAIDIQVCAASGDTANYLLQRENGDPPHPPSFIHSRWNVTCRRSSVEPRSAFQGWTLAGRSLYHACLSAALLLHSPTKKSSTSSFKSLWRRFKMFFFKKGPDGKGQSSGSTERVTQWSSRKMW